MNYTENTIRFNRVQNRSFMNTLYTQGSNLNSRQVHGTTSNNTTFIQLYTSETLENILSESNCPICFHTLNIENRVRTNCKHDFCYICISNCFSSNTMNNISCPICRTNIDKLEFINADIKTRIINLYQ
jgi:hypothetical protein